MRGLIKFTFLAFSLCLNLLAINLNSISDQSFSQSRYEPYPPPSAGFSSISGVSIIDYKYLKIGNDYYSYNNIGTIIFNLEKLKSSGFMAKYSGNSITELVNYDSSFDKIKIPCLRSGDGYSYCARSIKKSDPGYTEVEFSYYYKYSVTKVGSCQPDEHFNTQTKQCQKCSEGQSWDQENNICWEDCTDMSKNKWGFSNGTPQGSCFDCSNETTLLSAADCGCRIFGFHGSNFAGRLDDFPKCAYDAVCNSPGTSVRVYDPECDPNTPDVPKPDNNNTTPNDPGGGNSDTPGDNNNPGGDSGGGGNSGGGNNGQENNNNDDSGGGGPGGSEFCKKNPNHESCKPGKPGGDGNTTNNFFGGGGSGGGGNGDNKDKDKDGEAKFKESDFNSDGLNKEMGAFEKAYKGAFSKIEKEFEGAEGFNAFKNGIDQFINNLKGKGLNDISKKSMPKSCSHKETIDFFGYNVVMDFDFCKIVEPASGAFYYLFYVFFFGCFLFLIIKFLIFSF